jgi:kinesin family member 6/9
MSSTHHTILVTHHIIKLRYLQFKYTTNDINHVLFYINHTFQTHTMTGPANDDFMERGLCMRTAGCLFERSRKINATENNSISIRLSVLEIYNEGITDLLRNSPSVPTMASSAGGTQIHMQTTQTAQSQIQKLSIVDTPNGIIIPGLYLLPLSSEDDAYNLLFEAYSNRVVAEHQLNRRSSRSHVIYTYYITRTKLFPSVNGADVDPEVVNSKLHLIDLAGSERVEKTGSVGNLQKEASHINRSLTFLEQVVIALSQAKRDHIPYRQSKLTYLLKDSLGGNCHTFMVACIWPHEKHGWETLSTLRYDNDILSCSVLVSLCFLSFVYFCFVLFCFVLFCKLYVI